MAPLNLPPPALTLDEAHALEKLMVADKRFVKTDFVGSNLEEFLTTCKDPQFAGKTSVAIGDALLEHRLMRQVADEDGFALKKSYRLISQETPEVRALHEAQSKLISTSLVQGKIMWKTTGFLGLYSTFTPVYGFMTNEKLILLKSRSSAATPLAEFPVSDLVSVEECFECKADWYCFNIKMKSQGVITLCADHSKRMENWINALGSCNVAFVAATEDGEDKSADSLYELTARRLNTKDVVPLSEYKGKVCLVVNVSSQCGLTPQYAELEALYEKYKDEGLCVLGFPVNQFANQEPGTEAEIAQFAKEKYQVTFDLFEKTDANGANAHPVFKFVKGHLTGFLGSSVKWNFTKFLVDRDGVPIKRFAPTTTPFSFEDEIVQVLHEKH